MRDRLLGTIDYVAALAELRDREVNYDPSEIRPPDWNFDVHRSVVGRERPGPPEAGGMWEAARDLVRDYEFTPPELIRAVYYRRDPLLGRTLLLEGRFSMLRFYMGVRITALIDETRRQQQKVWGWTYETLEHHLERGNVTYEVVKHLNTGQVEFVASCQSQRSPAVGPVLRMGWRFFGRRTQLRFYRRCGQRLQELVRASLAGTPVEVDAQSPDGQSLNAQSPLGMDDLVLVPSGVEPHPLDRFAIRQYNPGR
ncbi:MAG: DUF1990 domain-containing protein [Actinomycetota bacterium]|nr:DUF1990 domain-containing protein [Actinomycetota bacterium]